MILFLNKKDIFDEKIQYFDLKDYFPDYRGKFCDSFEAKDFILEQFINPGRRLRYDILKLYSWRNLKVYIYI